MDFKWKKLGGHFLSFVVGEGEPFICKFGRIQKWYDHSSSSRDGLSSYNVCDAFFPG